MGTVDQKPSETQDALATRKSALEILRERTAAIVVSSQQEYITAAQVLADLKAYVKDCKRKRDDEIEPLKNDLDRKKNEWATYIAPAETLVLEVSGKTDAYKQEEKRQAQVEQDRKNAELARQAREKADADRKESERQAAETKRKRVAEINGQLKRKEIGQREAARLLKLAGADEEAAKENAAAAAEEAKNAPPPMVSVKPNIPTVAGVKNQTYYFGEIESPNTILLKYDTAILRGDVKRYIFLRQFLSVSETAVGKFARDTKDNDAATKQLPGVRFWSKG